MTADFRGKRVLVMGLGLHGGGVGTVGFLARRGARVTVTDLRTRKELAPSLKALAPLEALAQGAASRHMSGLPLTGRAKYRGIRYVLGRHRESDFISTDLIVKNPGVRRDNPFLKEAARLGIPITSDIGIFLRLCPAKIIGVTGTRGKSTTTYLIYKFLKTKFRRAHYGGNIRRSALAILPRIKKSDPVVLELSSFQLADLDAEKRSPRVAVITNIMPDHLNWHRNMREYQDAKAAIFRHQRPCGHSNILQNVGMSGGEDSGEDKGDIVIIPAGDAALEKMTRSARSRVIRARLARDLAQIVDRNLGAHYRPSVGLAVAAARHFGVGLPAIRNILEKFRGLEARQEEIAIVRGIHFINDTTATIPDAAIAAITRFRKRAGRNQLILIAGGQDKKLDFTHMAAAIQKYVDHLIVLPGSATQKLAKILYKSRADLRSVHRVESMKAAVKIAWQLAAGGDYIVLSPGAASFGLFLNEFDRGNQFVRAVSKL